MINQFVNGSMSIKALAKELTTVSDLVHNRTKIGTDELINNYPEGITINRVDSTIYDGRKGVVVTFAEDDTKFYNGGTALTKMFENIMVGTGKTIKEISQLLYEEGGLKIKFVPTFSKTGRQYIKPVVID